MVSTAAAVAQVVIEQLQGFLLRRAQLLVSQLAAAAGRRRKVVTARLVLFRPQAAAQALRLVEAAYRPEALADRALVLVLAAQRALATKADIAQPKGTAAVEAIRLQTLAAVVAAVQVLSVGQLLEALREQAGTAAHRLFRALL